MMLHLNASSERGKEVTKNGNDYVRTDFYGTREQGRIFCVIVTQKDDVATIEASSIDGDEIKLVYSEQIENKR